MDRYALFEQEMEIAATEARRRIEDLEARRCIRLEGRLAEAEDELAAAEDQLADMQQLGGEETSGYRKAADLQREVVFVRRMTASWLRRQLDAALRAVAYRGHDGPVFGAAASLQQPLGR